MSIKLTSYSHGAGCGCKLSPEVLSRILSKNEQEKFGRLLVGNSSKDDAAVYNLDDETAIISTTDFFTPIVDDPFDFGAISATNAISDIYAMGGKPIMAIAILGWPIAKLEPEIASVVIEGAKHTCASANIPLAGGHSIDTLEPIFGLAVTGIAPIDQIKKNTGAQEGDILFLTKPLGTGLVSTAQKKGVATQEDINAATQSMKTLNSLGADLSAMVGVNSITDVTGFGLGGHLIEMAEGSGLTAEISNGKLPQFPFTQKYLDLNMSPGGTARNWASYGDKVELAEGVDHRLIADPQTSGGLLISVSRDEKREFESYIAQIGKTVFEIGSFFPKKNFSLYVSE